MNYLHYEVDLGPEDAVEIALDRQANALLMDDANFRQYQHGAPYHYHGGHVRVSPIRIKAPRAGRWNVVIDLGGFAGRVRPRVGVLRAATVE